MIKYFFLPVIGQATWSLWLVFGVVWAIASWWLDMRKGIVPVIVIVVAYLIYFVLIRKLAPRFIKPLIELSENEISFRNPFNFPATVDRVPLEDLKSIEIVGPIDRRYIRCTFTDGAHRDIGAFSFSSAIESNLVVWLMKELPQSIRADKRSAATFFETVRGDY